MANYVFFWHEDEKNGEFSNWYSSPFVVDHFQYNHVEQYIMAQKAKLFGDAKHYTAILRADSPKECKSLGRLVDGFSDTVWESARYQILMTGLREKFSQNSTLKGLLLSTGNAILAEASPYDKIFGIGITADLAAKMAPDQWPGENILGKALMELRAQLAPAAEDRFELARSLTEQLLNGSRHYFSQLKPSALPEKAAGVYAITNAVSGEVLYVGRTKNLRRRLYQDHLMGPLTCARLKNYLIHDPTVSEVTDADGAKEYLKNNCYAQYLTEPELLPRGQLEGLLSFTLNVKYIDEEH